MRVARGQGRAGVVAAAILFYAKSWQWQGVCMRCHSHSTPCSSYEKGNVAGRAGVVAAASKRKENPLSDFFQGMQQQVPQLRWVDARLRKSSVARLAAAATTAQRQRQTKATTNIIIRAISIPITSIAIAIAGISLQS